MILVGCEGSSIVISSQDSYYWKVPWGTEEKREASGSFGCMFFSTVNILSISIISDTQQLQSNES